MKDQKKQGFLKKIFGRKGCNCGAFELEEAQDETVGREGETEQKPTVSELPTSKPGEGQSDCGGCGCG